MPSEKLPPLWEDAVRDIAYATRCEYKGHESMCNTYDCTRHEHPEVAAVRRVLRGLRRTLSRARRER